MDVLSPTLGEIKKVPEHPKAVVLTFLRMELARHNIIMMDRRYDFMTVRCRRRDDFLIASQGKAMIKIKRCIVIDVFKHH